MDHVLGGGVVQARLQRQHGVELGLVQHAELDQQRAELAVVLRLPQEHRVQARARQQACAGEELPKAEIGDGYGAFSQARR